MTCARLEAVTCREPLWTPLFGVRMSEGRTRERCQLLLLFCRLLAVSHQRCGSSPSMAASQQRCAALQSPGITEAELRNVTRVGPPDSVSALLPPLLPAASSTWDNGGSRDPCAAASCAGHAACGVPGCPYFGPVRYVCAWGPAGSYVCCVFSASLGVSASPSAFRGLKARPKCDDYSLALEVKAR